MIKIESVHIEEVRGVRKLDLTFGKEKFVISGPNGSGKSGVIDAIEFALTGEIGRLTGRGTQDLSLSEHGPHVDKTKFPEAAFVTLGVFLTKLGKSATITRKISDPKRPTIDPSESDVLAAFAEVGEHPEVTLSRREILRFILVEPTKRSTEIQGLLKLDSLGQTRSTLNSARNKIDGIYRESSAQVVAAGDALQRCLQIGTLTQEDLLNAVNRNRKILGLDEIKSLTPDTRIDAGLSEPTRSSKINKAGALRDIKALSDAAAEFASIGGTEASAIISELKKLEDDPALFDGLHTRPFVEKGLDLIKGPECPLCDHHWDDEQKLREHLKAKLSKSEEARKTQETLRNNGFALASKIVQVVSLITPVQKLAALEGLSETAERLTLWSTDLESLKVKLTNIDSLVGLKDRFVRGWVDAPEMLGDGLKSIGEKINSKPDQSAAIAAQTVLNNTQLRLDDYREAMRKNKKAEGALKIAKVSYDTYCEILEQELDQLYDQVQQDFSIFYRLINDDDEVSFTAKLTPSEGSLDLAVNFYDKGLFPPAALHSEGHQDGMGICLYLALMKRLFGEGFTFALLDDVVTSVDSEHRYKFCKLLKAHFPDTQFIITTHDRVWAEQMKWAGLVTARTSVAFHGWSIDTGPLVESNDGIWVEIAASLGKGKVEVAAAALRRHLEYVSRHLAHQICASVPFRADGNYELGDLLPNVLSQLNKLYGKAADVAQSWGKEPEKAAAVERREKLSKSNGATTVEQWAVNPAVHYNEWANFGKKDFEPVVAAFKDLLDCFRCDSCDSWLHLAPRVKPESLKCDCDGIRFNLKSKSK